MWSNEYSFFQHPTHQCGEARELPNRSAHINSPLSCPLNALDTWMATVSTQPIRTQGKQCAQGRAKQTMIPIPSFQFSRWDFSCEYQPMNHHRFGAGRYSFEPSLPRLARHLPLILRPPGYQDLPEETRKYRFTWLFDKKKISRDCCNLISLFARRQTMYSR